MGFDRGLRELGDLAGLADIDAVNADLLRTGATDLGGNTLQPGLVAIGECEIAAARGKLDRQRPADAAASARHGCGGSTNRGHGVGSNTGKVLCGKPYTAGRLWQQVAGHRPHPDADWKCIQWSRG